MLELRNVGAAYGKHTALAGIDLAVGEREIVVILGANGAGKSTLLKVIAGVVRHLPGSVVALGARQLEALPPHEIVEAGIALVPEGRGIFAEMTVGENLLLGANPRRARGEEKRNRDIVLSLFPRLSERLAQPVRTMSGGEQQMVAIGRALMSAPEVLLLDEPSLGLSPILARELFDALVRIRETGVSVLLVEQNAKASLRIADRGYLLETGRIVGEGEARRLAADPAVREAYLGVAGHATLPAAETIEMEALAGPLEADDDVTIDATVNLPLAGRSRSASEATPASGGGRDVSDSGLVTTASRPDAFATRNRSAISTSPQGGGWSRSTPDGSHARQARGGVSEDEAMFHTKLIIADRELGAGNSRTFDRLDPVTGEIATRAAAASIGDTHKAAEAAAAAFPEWSQLAPTERRRMLLKAADILQSKVDDFAAAVIAETGSPGHWAHFNVGLAADMIREAASMTTQITGEVIPANRPGSMAFAMRQPAGVILSIAPWNAPIILGVRSVAMPLACGNTVVFKASENCPRTHALIVESFREAGLPKGVINLVTNAPADAAKIVEALIAHPKVKRVNFTGSTRVGRIVAEIAARYLKPVLLELGGKAPLIVLDDADIDEAVNAAVFGSFANAGQICMSTEKIVLDNRIADAFLAKFTARAGGLPAGDPRGHVVFGSCISTDAVRRVADLIRDAVQKGATVLAGGPADGPIMQATVVDRVTPAMRLYEEESFGPVVSVIRVDGEEEAISAANDTEYGLSAAVYTRDIARGLRVAQRIKFGHLPHQRADGARRGADAVRRHQELGLRPLRRQGGDRRIHRAPLDHGPDRADAVSVLRSPLAMFETAAQVAPSTMLRMVPLPCDAGGGYGAAPMTTARTGVGIVGAGPAGLLLSHLLAREGIASIVIEDTSREHVESRIRAGVLEQGTADLLAETGVGARMEREGLIHEGIEIRFNGEGHRIDFPALTGGKAITVYGQQEVVKDLIAARLADGGVIHFEVEGAAVHGIDGDAPRIACRLGDEALDIACDFIAGCDGFHGICRDSVPGGVLTAYERVYPFAWLGILAETPPASDELIYAHSERGFALLSMRSPTLSRLYVQCGPDDDVAAWPDDRVWDELAGADGDSRRHLPHRRGAGAAEGHHPDAELRRRADAVRPAFSRRRCRPYRAADRRQGDEPRSRRRPLPHRGACPLVPERG